MIPLKLTNSIFFQKNRKEIFLFIFALTIRIIFLLVILWWQGRVGDFDGRPAHLFPILGGDSTDYYLLANNIINHFKFSIPEANFFPESLRVPGYPLFVASILFFTKSLLAVVIVQDILSSLAVVFFYKFAKIFFSEKIAFISSLLIVFEPSGLFFSNVILTESFFLFLFILFLYYFFRHQKKPTFFSFFVSGLLLGFAALTRPVAQFLLLFFCTFIIYLHSKLGYKKALSFLFFLVLGFALIALPWAIRNKLIFDSWQLSSVGIFNFYNYHVPIFLSIKEGVNEEAKIAEFQNKFNADKIPKYEYWTLYNINEFKDITKHYIFQDPIGFCKVYIIKTIPFFLSDGLRDVLRSLRLLPPPKVNFTTLILEGKARELIKIFSAGDTDVIVFIIGFSLWSLITFFFLFRLFIALGKRNNQERYVIFLSILVFYFAIATGPVSNGRFRMQVAPLMIVLAISGFFEIYKRLFKSNVGAV